MIVFILRRNNCEEAVLTEVLKIKDKALNSNANAEENNEQENDEAAYADIDEADGTDEDDSDENDDEDENDDYHEIENHENVSTTV